MGRATEFIDYWNKKNTGKEPKKTDYNWIDITDKDFISRAFEKQEQLRKASKNEQKNHRKSK